MSTGDQPRWLVVVNESSGFAGNGNVRILFQTDPELFVSPRDVGGGGAAVSRSQSVASSINMYATTWASSWDSVNWVCESKRAQTVRQTSLAFQKRIVGQECTSFTINLRCWEGGVKVIPCLG